MSDPVQQALEQLLAGRYTIERELGRGGMGTVYLARDLSLERHVAIKVLPPELAAQPALRERFVREAKLAASLSHPNIVHVHAVEEQNDLLAFVMQYVDGETLSDRVARSGPYAPADCARLIQDMAWALGYAHARGIVHRDVKPDNVMIERGTGRALIMDFGIARQERASGLTEVGHSIGTPQFMSPEQAAAETVDGRSDLYSLGCVGYFAATGRPPFEGESAHKLLMQHLTVEAPAVTSVRAEFPKGLSELIGTALKKEPSARFPTGEAMADAVEALNLRGREIAPLLRLFHQQTAQSLQSMIFIAAICFGFLQVMSDRDPLLRVFAATLFLTVAIAIVLQLVERARFVVRQGFGLEDVRSAIAGIEEEIGRARDLLLNDPVEQRRAKKRMRWAFGYGVLAGMLIPVTIMKLSRRQDALEVMLPTNVVLMAVATLGIALPLAVMLMRPSRVTPAQRLAGRFWSGPVGSSIFRRVEKRYEGERRRSAESQAS